MEFIYAQLNEDLVCIGISILSDEVNSDTLVKLEMLDESCIGRKYEDGEWSEEKYIEEHKEEIGGKVDSTPEPTEQELIQAELLLNQTQILINQEQQDMVLAELLLNQIGGV